MYNVQKPSINAKCNIPQADVFKKHKKLAGLIIFHLYYRIITIHRWENTILHTSCVALNGATCVLHLVKQCIFSVLMLSLLQFSEDGS